MALPKKSNTTRNDKAKTAKAAGGGAESTPRATGAAAPAIPAAPAAEQARPRPASTGRRSRPLVAVLLALGALLLLVALLDYRRNQGFFFGDNQGDILEFLNPFFPKTETNIMGEAGATISVLLYNFAGLAAFFVPFCLLVIAWHTLFARLHRFLPWYPVRMCAALFALATLLARLDRRDPSGFVSLLEIEDLVPRGVGGALGNFIYQEAAVLLLGSLGTLVVFLLLYAYCVVGMFVENPAHFFTARVRLLRALLNRKLRTQKPVPEKAKTPADAPVDAAAEKPAPASEQKPAAAPDASDAAVPADFPELPDSLRLKPLAGDADDFAFLVDAPDAPPLGIGDNTADNRDDFDGDGIGGVPVDSPSAAADAAAPEAATTTAADAAFDSASAPISSDQLTVIDAEVVERADDVLEPKKRGDYQIPPITLLKDPPPTDDTPHEDYAERMDRLINTLGEFKIKVLPGDIQAGPVITRYEVVPAPGVRVEKIAGLSNNLAMNLKSESVRVIAPVPGKGTVGIEVPNKNAKAVLLREIIESKQWVDKRRECKIPVVLGKDVTGRPMIYDLAKMPHCLIAGSTGSGKSVCINCIVASLAYHAGPEDIRFVMVDPKVVELKVYNDLPHMLIPVETDPKRVPAALKFLINEMERRYQLFSKTGVRNIVGFNAKLSKDRSEAESAKQLELELSPEERAAAALSSASVPRDEGVIEDELPKEKLPYIVCIIDELADLMMVAPAEIETAIARLAQLARAAGIHLILATQRPSVNVITGIIKANLPCRISFKTTSNTDSRTILDQKGAETLIGKGDMLFIPPGSAHLVRAQGAFLSDEEVESLIKNIADTNGKPDFDLEVMQFIQKSAAEDEDAEDNAATEGTDDPDEDPMFKKAWEVVRTSERASTSLLQRKLSIGYGRAAKIIDALEERGYIGPDRGPGTPRDILMK